MRIEMKPCLSLIAAALILCPATVQAGDSAQERDMAAMQAQPGASAAPAPQQDTQEMTAHHELAAHEVIDGLMSALRRRDADQAMALTTSGFHGKYTDSDHFLGSVRLKYRALHNHDGYEFLDASPIEGGLIQKVRLNGRNGAPLTVIYRLQEQADGRWLIDSFTVLDLRNAQPI